VNPKAKLKHTPCKLYTLNILKKYIKSTPIKRVTSTS